MAATPEEAIRARLSSDSTVNGLTGGRINPQVNTQEPALPFVVFKRLGGAASTNLDGVSTIARYVFQIDIYAASESAAAALAAAIESRLYGWADRAGGVQGVVPDDTAADLTDDPWRVWSRVFGIWFEPTS